MDALERGAEGSPDVGLLVASVVTNDIAYATNRPSCSTRSHLRVRSLGQDGLPTRYGFDKSRDYRGWILGRVRAATSRRLPALRPASSTQTSERFSGGEATVVPALTALGCSIIRVGENEVVAMVVNYFEVLHAQSQGAYNTHTWRACASRSQFGSDDT